MFSPLFSIFILLVLWILPWKGYSLWLAAKRGNTVWFIILLVLNTFSILDMIYVFGVVKKKPKDVWNALNQKL